MEHTALQQILALTRLSLLSLPQRAGAVGVIVIGIAGVVGVLEGGLPVKSTAKAQWAGQEVGVMHACGHDNHMAILLGTATALERMKDRSPGAPSR